MGIMILVAVLNIAAWNSRGFSDWYIAHIFPVWVNVYGRITGLLPFSAGEWMLGAGIVLAVLAGLLGVLWTVVGVQAGVRRIYCCARRHVRGIPEAVYAGRLAGKALGEPADTGEGVGLSGKAVRESSDAGEGVGLGSSSALQTGRTSCRAFGSFRRFSRSFGCFFAWTILFVSLIMTLNCFILYHASTFSEHYFGEDTGEYTLVELIEVYNMVAGQCNSLAGEIERGEDGMAKYSGSVGKDGTPLDMEDKARELMRQLGGTYPQLDGYYPRPKAMFFSDFMCQQYMQGYYFPFSMEANYNDVMHILNFPATMCHELAHLRGYIYEDEANFIGYLACVESEDDFFRYAGYLSVLVYLNNDLYKAWKEERAAYEEAAAVVQPVAVDAQVWEDNIFVTAEEWERINGKALINTEIVNKAADAFIDANLKVNGIADGKISYSRVVRLLLQYYRRKR